MPIPFAPGTRVRTVFTGDSKSAIIDAVRTALVAAGWTVVGGSGDEKYDCVTTAQSLQCRVRVYDGGGTCARIKFSNVTEDAVGQDFFLVPRAAPTEYCVIANQHQFFVLAINEASVARTFVCGGVPFLDPPLYTPVRFITESIWSCANGISDAGVTQAPSFRANAMARSYWTDLNRIYTNTLSSTSGNMELDDVTLIVKAGLSGSSFDGGQGTTHDTGYLHHSLQSNKIPARIMWGRSNGVFRRIKGTLWDVVLINSPAAAPIIGDSLHSFDDYNWHCVTEPTAIAANFKAGTCVFVAYESL